MIAKPVEIKHQFEYGNCHVRIYHASKGEGIPKHSHPYDHATFCNAGSCIIRTANVTATIDKDSKPLNLVGKEWHEIEALENGTVFVNVFAEGKY